MRAPPIWFKVFGFACLLNVVHLAAVPTDTVVVANSDDVVEKQTVAPEPTTEEPTPPIKLTEMDVTSTISLRYARTAIVAHVKNPAKKAQEAHFRVLLPETAFISGFVMTLDGKSYKAYVKEKEEAKQIYQDAVSQGISAAHVSAKARDSNHFTVTVNVEALSSAIFNLTYEELLNLRNGVYNYVCNLHPGALVPKLTVTVHISESDKITELRVPEIRTGNEIDATKDDAQNTKVVIERGHDDREATITFNPDLVLQQQLMQIYAQKSKESASNTYYESTDNENKDGVLGQFVVQYNVDRTNDVLVNDGYFVHFFAPKDLPILNKYVMFVLDTSGSMMGRKIVQLREAMMTILNDLNPGDYFNIVEFASTVTVHDLKEADQEPPKRHYYYYDEDYSKPPTLVDPSLATPENIAKAKVIVSRLDAVGGTNIDAALDVAVSLNNRRFKKARPEAKSNSTEPVSTVTGDGLSTEATTLVTEVTTENYENFKGIKSLEPMIIFLTDGEATVGNTNPAQILSRLSEKNYGPQNATIFALGFGNDADIKFLRKLGLRNNGFARHIYEAGDAALQLRDFYHQVSSPLVSNVKFSYPPDQVKSGTVTKDQFRTFYAGSEIVVAGQLADDVTEFTPQLSGFCGVTDDGSTKKKYEKNAKVPIPLKKQGYMPLERLWAYLTIKQLLDKKDAAEEGDKPVDTEETPQKKALDLALKYEFVTPLTSLVVVKPNMTSAVNAESVDEKKVMYDSYGGGFVPLSGAYNSAPAAYPTGAFASGFASPVHGPVPSSIFQTSALSLPSFEAFQESETLVDDYDLHDSFSDRTYFYSPLNFSTKSMATVPRWDTYVPPITTPPPALTTSAPAHTQLSAYHLEDFHWADSILNSTIDALVLQLNETVTLKLTKETEAPKSAAGDATCANAVLGGDGLCVYLTRCQSAKQITVDDFKSNYCLVDQGYAGVCCPKKDIQL